jgi:hypothetical protein
LGILGAARVARASQKRSAFSSFVVLCNILFLIFSSFFFFKNAGMLQRVGNEVPQGSPQLCAYGDEARAPDMQKGVKEDEVESMSTISGPGNLLDQVMLTK